MIARFLDDPFCGAFWKAAQQERLALCWCGSCESAVWYPRLACPDCETTTHWQKVSGRARLHSWTEVAAAINPDFPEPYIVGLVVPEEAPRIRLVTQLVDCEEAQLSCDMPLEVCFRRLPCAAEDDYLAPMFRPP